METRQAKIQIGNSGGTAGKNAMNCRVSLPTKWIKEMGINEENRNITISFDGEKIVIEKGKQN